MYGSAGLTWRTLTRDTVSHCRRQSRKSLWPIGMDLEHRSGREASMLLSLNSLRGSTLRATDGDIGHVDDMYFDADRWVVRYLVIETAPLSLPLLISSLAIVRVDMHAHAIETGLTR